MNWSFGYHCQPRGSQDFYGLGERVAANISIPFTVGGGINELSDVDRLLSAGADKVSINSSAIRNPNLIDEIAKHFGSQVCVVAIDAKQTDQGWKCYLNGGRVETDKYLSEWAREVNNRGAGEILFTSMNHDGVKTGYANKALATLSDSLTIPVIASGGAGKWNISRILLSKEKLMRHLQPAFFTSEKSKYPN